MLKIDVWQFDLLGTIDAVHFLYTVRQPRQNMHIEAYHDNVDKNKSHCDFTTRVSRSSGIGDHRRTHSLRNRILRNFLVSLILR